jgi:hypothetical protein
LEITHWIKIIEGNMVRDGHIITTRKDTAPENFYRQLQYSYPKFFKMDVLCKWAWLGAETLLHDQAAFAYEGMDKNRIAVVMATAHGCLEVDKKYQQSMQTIPSPALFVYTLSNIMLGEICIRHGFKGEQMCLVNDRFDSSELYFYVSDLLENRGMDACLCGWVDAVNDEYDVRMFWVVKDGKGLPFSSAAMEG